MITSLVTVDSEQRLGKTLLQLARTLGKQDPRSIRIEQRISHEELASMVDASRFLIVKEHRLMDYLAQID